MKYFKVNKDLYVVAQDVVVDGAKKKPSNVNHVIIYDRSGSMGGTLSSLIEDLKTHLRKVQLGDTVSLGWFSGEGSFRFPLKGHKVTSNDDFKALDKVLDANSTIIGTTCFSEILADTEQVVKDLKPFGDNFSLMFLSDGYPVVSNYNKEVTAINNAIKKVAGKVTSAVLVGYGDYYNKELMADMTEKFGGQLVHSSDLKSLDATLESYVTNAGKSKPRVIVELAMPQAAGLDFAFSIHGNAVNTYAIDKNVVAYLPSGEDETVYFFTDKKPAGKESALTKGVYAAAYTLTQRAKTDLAMKVMSAIGDVALVTQLNNAFTNADYGKAELALLDAMNYENRRFTGGHKVDCLPKDDAFCLMDALDLLMSDSEAEFQPFHDAFEYKKVGVGTKTKAGYPEFKPDRESRVPLTDLVWNDTKLNLSIRALINGEVDLPKKSVSGLTRPAGISSVRANIWRNYTIVRDGFLNVTKLPVSLSKKTYEKFLAEGVIDQEHNRHYAGRVYVLHLDRLPVINRAAASTNLNAHVLCDKVLTEAKVESFLKVAKAELESLVPRKERVEAALSSDPSTAAFLRDCGMTVSNTGEYTFSPPTEKLDPVDFYMAKEFKIKVKGMSSLPKVDDVKAKVAAKKELTGYSEYMADALKTISKDLSNVKSSDRVTKLETLIANARHDLYDVRSTIQRTKYAVLLSKRWFSDLKSREDNKLEVSGHDFTIEVTDTRVDI